jgi:hypothetical protein
LKIKGILRPHFPFCKTARNWLGNWRLDGAHLAGTTILKGWKSFSPATVLNWQLFFQSFFGAFGAGWASSALS